MMPAPKGLGLLYLQNRERAGERLRAALVAAKGNLGVACAKLGIRPTTLREWLARFPGGEGYVTCRDWLDATYPQPNDPRKVGRRRAGASAT